MPISHNNNIIFVHIPKNGGTSMCNALGIESGHYRWDFYKKQNCWSSYFKFCIVRNPWDRVVSCYEYSKMEDSYHHSVNLPKQHGIHPDYFTLKSLTFEECVYMLKDSPEKLKHQGWLSQSYWICDENNNIMINNIFKIEFLQKNLLKHPILNTFSEKLKKLNPSPRKKNYKDYYSLETKNIIAEIYKTDVENFNYDF